MAARHALVHFILSLQVPAFVIAAAFAVTFLATTSRPVAASSEESVRLAPPVENSKNQFLGEVNANNVSVRSGPAESFYATQQLKKGDRLTVVGIKNGWLKVVPPAGSFSYVAKAYVKLRGDGTVGRVNNTLNVRAGSKLNKMKVVVQTKLEPGADVKIIGEEDEYFIIKPPADAYLFVDHRYVKPIEQVPPARKAEAPPAEPIKRPVETVVPPPADPPPGDDVDEGATQPDEAIGEAADPETQPGGDEEAEPEPSAATAELYEKLNAEFVAADRTPVPQQPVEELLGKYEELAKAEGLEPRQRAIVDARLTALRQRAKAQRVFEKVTRGQEQEREQLQVLRAEEGELAERVRQNQVKVYAAVGTLRVSSLQQGGQTLYRLTDPVTARTVVYVRTDDPQYVDLLNQFVGVKGTVEFDRRLNLKVVTPTAAEAVDPTSLGNGVVAQVIPPSLLPTASTAEPVQE